VLHAFNAWRCAPESAPQQRGESPLRRAHWLFVAEGNCVVERRGGEQPEANYQSLSKTILNSIRPDAMASLRLKGEAKNWKLPRRGKGDSDDLYCVRTVSVITGLHRVIGEGMAGSWGDVNQGSRAGKRKAFMAEVGPKSNPEGDRALVVAKKRGNSRGAKGGREVEA